MALTLEEKKVEHCGCASSSVDDGQMCEGAGWSGEITGTCSVWGSGEFTTTRLAYPAAV